MMYEHRNEMQILNAFSGNENFVRNLQLKKKMINIFVNIA